MGRGFFWFLVSTSVPLLAAGTVQAAGYPWRGLRLSESPVLQPSIWLGKGISGASVWASLSSGTRPFGVRADELDQTLEYKPAGRTGWSAVTRSSCWQRVAGNELLATSCGQVPEHTSAHWAYWSSVNRYPRYCSRQSLQQAPVLPSSTW